MLGEQKRERCNTAEGVRESGIALRDQEYRMWFLAYILWHPKGFTNGAWENENF